MSGVGRGAHLVLSSAVVEERWADVAQQLEALEDQRVHVVVPVVLGDAKEHGEENGHERRGVCLEI